MSESSPLLSTQEKALKLNLDQRRYGTFAEIGAGQEVARWFFQVGGAAGTIAKSISAYDMQVSDAIYGKAQRYVCRERLESMLEYEQGLNRERLTRERGDTTAFFAFADTVSARNYRGTNECHGWMGVRFQAHAGDEDSQIIIHVRMWDKTNALQQEALGIVGVNLVYGATMLHHDTDALVESLFENLGVDRLEIDMIEFSGIEFRNVDNRLMSLKLVQLGLTDAAMIGPNGEMLQPSSVIRKRPVLVQRGSFRPVCNTNMDILKCARARFEQEPDVDGERILELMEITMSNLMADDGGIEPRDFLARADLLTASGMTVLISDFSRFYRLAAYIARYTSEKVGVMLGAANLERVFDEQYYEDLAGGILEAMGRLFKNDLKLLIYPCRDQKSGGIVSAESLQLGNELQNLLEYLLECGRIVGLQCYDETCLDIYAKDVLRMIAEGNHDWEKMVPAAVAEVIKSRKYFDFAG